MEVPEPQPAKAVLALRRISQKCVAAQLGVSPIHLGRVLNGWSRPSARLAKELAELLGKPVEELFRPEDLERLTSHPGDRVLAGGAR